MADDGGGADGLEHLAISFAVTAPVGEQWTKRLVLRSTEAAQGWIRHATRRQSTAKSFVLKLRYADEVEELLREQPKMDLSDLLPAASSAKLESMHWELGGVRLQLPATAVFTSLVDLSLENIELVDDSGHRLSRLLSSACCTSLQKLQLRNLTLPELYELVIDASALLELSVSSCWPIVKHWNLKLKTPSLRILHFEECDYLRTLAIFGPRLEKLTFLNQQPDYIVVDGELPCMGRLKVNLFTHEYIGKYKNGYDVNNGSMCLLRCCTSLTSLELSLNNVLKEVFGPNIISGRISHLPHLTSLTIHVVLWYLHLFGIGIAEILKQCSCLKYLVVHCIQNVDSNHSCKHPADHWKSHQIYFANIQEVQFTGLAGTLCESSFIRQGVLGHATQLKKVALSFDPEIRLYNMIDCSRFIPFGGGTWVCQGPSSLSY